MPTVFLNPPASDPALTARTFSQNPTLSAALARIRERAAQQAQPIPQPNPAFMLGGQESSGSDAAPEPPVLKLDVP